MRLLFILLLLIPLILSQNDVGSSSGGGDYNPELDGGTRGGPGIRARINQPGFDYFSKMIPPLLGELITKAEIPTISQCLPQIGGCIRVDNLRITNFQCPSSVRLHPSPPNKIVISVENVGVTVVGTLNGQITVLRAMRLFGNIVANANQISTTIELSLTRNQDGSPHIEVAGCRGRVRNLDIMIQNGGTLGDLANTQFRQQISRKVRKMIPSQLCAKIPEILNSKLNEQVELIPTTISVSKLLDVAGSALGIEKEGGGSGGSGGSGSEGGSSSGSGSDSGSSGGSSSDSGSSSSGGSGSSSSDSGSSGSSSDASVTGGSSSGSKPPPDAPASPSSYGNQRFSLKRRIAGSTQLNTQHQIYNSRLSNLAPHRIANRVVRQAEEGEDSESTTTESSGGSDSGSEGGSSDSGSSGSEGGSGGLESKAKDAGIGGLKELTKFLDMSKLEDLSLSIGIKDTHATDHDYTIDLDGEFSQNGNGGTPFGPYPLEFPSENGEKMAEALISDYTLNSLFYTLHKVQFLSVKLDNETPLIGPLLKTTCSDDEEGLEDNGVETDESTSSSVRKSRKFQKLFNKLRKRRSRRQLEDLAGGGGGGDDAGGSLADLGICLGDILPIAREKYPNKNVVVEVSTERAPSIILSSKDDGTATIDFVANAHLKTDSGDDIGTIHVTAEFEVNLKVEDNKLKGHGEITKLNLTDPNESLGLNQDALDSLSNLGKDMIAKQVNNFLEKGIPIELPSGSGGLPIEFKDPEFKILDHAIYLASDIKIDESLISKLTGSSGGGGGGQQCEQTQIGRRRLAFKRT